MKGTAAATNSGEGIEDSFREDNDNPPEKLRIVTMNCNSIYDRCLRENQHRFQQAAANQDLVLFPEFHLKNFQTQDPSLFHQFGSRSLPTGLSQGQPSGPVSFMLSAAGEQRKHDSPDKNNTEGSGEGSPHKRTRQT